MSQQPSEGPSRKGINTLRHTSVFRIVNFELFARPVSSPNGSHVSIDFCHVQSKFVMTFGVLCMSAAVGFLVYINLNKEEPKPAYKRVLTEDGYTTKKRTRWES